MFSEEFFSEEARDDALAGEVAGDVVAPHAEDDLEVNVSTEDDLKDLGPEMPAESNEKQ